MDVCGAPMKYAWFIGALLVGVLAGCEPARPGFLVRLQQDCQTGDQDACGLLAGPAMAPSPQRPVQQTPRPRTAVQADVEAIMRGMDRSRADLRSPVILDEGG
jgi:hypothetical protein